MTRRAFSIIELVVAIGIIMILIGLLLPTLSNTRQQVTATVSLSNARQIGAILTQYAEAHDGVFPIADERFWFQPSLPDGSFADKHPFGRTWYWALLDAGHASETQLFATDDIHISNYELSMALCYPPSLMVPNALVHPNEWTTSPVRTHQMVFPSLKGVLSPILVTTASSTRHWCCTHVDPPGPVAFGDGSAEATSWHQLPAPDYAPLLGIGQPVKSTWYGIRGRDR